MTEHLPIARPARTRRGSAPGRTGRRPRHRYFAFLSYSHKDEELARWLHRELEQFRVPYQLVGKMGEHGPIPRRLTPIFRDRQELGAATDLGAEIEEALSGSRFLIVLCSPAAAASRWTNAEIAAFKKCRPEGCVLAAIASGVPFASEAEAQEGEECFPPALRQRYDRLGRPTGKRAEPLAADLREEQGGRRAGFLRLVAGMLGVGLDDLVQRETTRRQRRLAYLAAGSLAGMALTSVLAVTAIQARDEARDQRREAEGLVAFMLGDLKDKLEPIGKLDALDGVGSRVLAYYRDQDASELSDSALMQRSRALSLSAQVAYLRGDFGSAQKLYNEAMRGTAEAIERDSQDPQRLFEHAQNVFYFGTIAADKGDLGRAERAFREYRSLADRMTAIEPDSLKWKMEVQYAATNLGFVLIRQRRYDEAVQQLTKALRTIEAVAAIDGDNREYQKSLAESLAWLADAQLSRGDINGAIVSRRRQVELLRSLAGSGDVSIQGKLIPALQTLGTMLSAQGKGAEALPQLQAAVATSEKLVPIEPGNSQWLILAGRAHLALAQHALISGQRSLASSQAERGCTYAARLQGAKPSLFAAQLQQFCMRTRAQVALANGDPAEAATQSRNAALIARSTRSNDPAEDRYALARSLLLTGDSRRAAGDRKGAQSDWQSGLELTRSAREKPGEMAVRAELLDRSGRTAEAARLRAVLASRGFRHAMLI